MATRRAVSGNIWVIHAMPSLGPSGLQTGILLIHEVTLTPGRFELQFALSMKP